MYGHLTCPEIFWHVSNKRIGLISNPDLKHFFDDGIAIIDRKQHLATFNGSSIHPRRAFVLIIVHPSLEKML